MTWDQIHPGLIFPKAEVTAIAFDHVAVKLFFEEEIFTGVLKGRYIAKEATEESKVIRQIRPGRIFNNLVVINKDTRTNNVEVALFKYTGKLIKYFERYFSLSMRPPLAAWEMDARESYNEQCGQSVKMINRSSEGHRTWVEVQGKYSAVFFQQDNLVEGLEGPVKFFPQILDDSGIRTPPLCTYKTDGGQALPLHFTAELEEKDRSSRKVNICLHWMTTPVKWHTNTRKHIVLDVLKKPALMPFWGLSPNSLAHFFNNCPEIDPDAENTQCNSQQCRTDGTFAEVHKKIKDGCQNFLKNSVTFFEDLTTNSTGKPFVVWLGFPNALNKSAPVKRLEMFLSGNKNGYESSLQGRLSLKGYCFNDDSENPTLHLQIITCYVDLPGRNLIKPDGYVFDRTAKLKNITKVC